MQPNIIIVMTDQQRADLRKARGYALDTMPFLDKWAGGGVDFAAAYTPNPTCMPARVSMFTGRYISCHRVRTNHNVKDAYYTEDLLDVVKAAGYRTALCGKNHSHHEMEDFDFHECNGHLGNECGEVKTPQEQTFADILSATRHMEIPDPVPGGVEIQYPYRNVSSALRFIDGTPGDIPFFLWLSFAEPHNPYQVPEAYFDMFPPEGLPPIPTGAAEAEKKGPRFQWTRERWEEILGDDFEQRMLRSRSNYHGMLRLIDDQFKRLITGLEERGIADDTVVVFLSDHGDFVGEYGMLRKGPDLPDVLCRIPMIWRGPGITPQGLQETAFVNTVDILPTLCDILGRELPFGCQGKSLLPLLKNKDIPKGEFDLAYSESGFSGLYWDDGDTLDYKEEGMLDSGYSVFDCLNTWSQCGQVRMIRKGSHKLQLDMMGTGYLYNLAEDPREVNNLWDDAGCREVKTDLLAGLAAQMLRACDPLPAPRRRYRVKVHPKGYWRQPYHSADPGVRDLPVV